MILTEEDAATKWCPHSGSNPTPFSVPEGTWVSTENIKINCVGSGCMAWVWDNNTEYRGHCSK
jgi:hypothetical protein